MSETLRIRQDGMKEIILFRIGQGQLEAVLESNIRNKGMYSEELELFILDFPELIQLRDFLNKYAPPSEYKFKDRRSVIRIHTSK